MPPSTSSWSSVRSSTTLGLREPAATRETPRQQPSSSSARLQAGRRRGLCRRGPPGARGRSRMTDRAPGEPGDVEWVAQVAEELEAEEPQEEGRYGESRGLGSGVFSPGAIT